MNKKKVSEILLAVFPVIMIFVNQLFLYFGNKSLFAVYVFLPFYSIVIVYAFLLLFVFITKSFKKANTIILITSFILSIINQIKMYYMQEPIYISDIKLLGGIEDIFDITSGTLGNSILNSWYIFLIFIIIYIGLFIGIKKCEDKKIENRKYFFAIPFTLLVVLALPFDFMTKFTLNKVYVNYKLKDYNAYWSNAYLNFFYGLSGGMYYNMLNNRVTKPNNYNIDDINKVLTYKTDNETYSNEDYNIILLFSESFFDVTKLNEIEFSDNLLKDYHELSNEGKLIQMISPTYGGRSCNVEMELLTSFNLAYYESSYTPYLQLVTKNFNKDGNLLEILKNKGMKNYSLISTTDNIYNVGNVYSYLGFEKLNNEGTKEDKKGYYLSDNYIVNNIIDFIGKEENPFFCFATTMQNHMPYLKDKYDNYTVSIKNSNLSEKDKEVILAYAEGLNDSSIELKRLYEYIKTLNKKTIIIFLGDHLPYLSNIDGKNLVDSLEYFNTTNTNVNNYRVYNTEALILSNFDIPFDDTKYLSPDLLIPYLLKTLNIKMNNYYDYLINESKEILPSYNKYVAVDREGNIYSTSELPNDMQKEYDLRGSVQYKLYYE